ncbi:MAG: hypothetical protein MJE63_21590 [Proteobacteria bacterium]|nr:hypothetical protein [Pseudomonadota bacterium]
MHKSILVLEESRMVHELFESALPEDYISWEVNHESTPDKYLQKAEETNPDIIFLSNQDKERNYNTVKQLKSSPEFSHTPILLFTSAKDTLDESHLQSIGVKGFVRKPFETSTLQKQINVVLKEQEQEKVDSHKDRLKDINVVDDDLMDLLGGQGKPEVSLDELEEELDPTLQLIPEDSEEDEETEETELLAMDDSGELEQAEFIDDEIDSNLDLDAENDLEIEDIEDDIELGELDDESDFMDLDDDPMTAVDLEPDDQFIRTIQVVEADNTDLQEPLLNVPEDNNDLGFMELHVVPLRSEKIKSHVVETITEDFDEEEFVKKHAPVELEDDFMSTDSEIIMDITQDGDEGDIEIPHEEIVEDFYEGDDDLDAEAEVEEEELLELSIEGMNGELSDELPVDREGEAVVAIEELDDSEDSIEEINIPEMDLPEDIDDIELVSQDDELTDEGELATVSQDDEVDFSTADDGVDVEIDFHSNPMPEPTELDEPQPVFSAFDEDEVDEESLTVSELEKRRSDQLDIELEEIAAAGSEEASSTIQEMIGFRQVMKAKYDIPEEDLEVDDLADGVTDEIGEDEDLFSEVEGSFADEEEAGDLLDEEMDLMPELSEDDTPGEPEDFADDNTELEEPTLMTELPEEEDSLSDTMEESENSILAELPDSDDQDDFSPLPEEFSDEDDATLLAELPEEDTESEIGPLIEEADEEDALLAELPDEEGETDDLFMEEASEDELSLVEEIPEPSESQLMDDTVDDLDIPDSPGDLLLDVDESNAEETDNLDLLTDEIDDETEEDDLALLSDEVDTSDVEDEQLDDIDLLSDMDDEEPVIEVETENSVFEESASPVIDDTDDDMFTEPPDLPMAEALDDDMSGDDDIFASSDDDADALMEPTHLSDGEQTDLLSIDEDDSLELDGPMEEIELLSDDTSEEDEDNLFQADDETDEDMETLAIDEDDSLDDTTLEMPEELVSETEAEFDATASTSMDDIDFLPMDEESDEDDVELEVEIDDTATTDENTEFTAETSEADHSVDDIDFLPVDEEEASLLKDEEQIEDIPLVALSEESEETSQEDTMSDIDFMPTDTVEELPEMDEVETTAEKDSITEEDEVTIEVPQETFEMGDFNIGDITSDDENDVALNDEVSDEEGEDMDLMSGIETVNAGEESDFDETTDEEESYDDIELPTMDDDLPDLPPINTDDEDLEEESIEEYADPISDESDIQLMQEQSDFDDFDSEKEIIGLTEEATASAGGISESDVEEVKQQAQKAAASLTPEFRKKLSEMIEGVVSETVHNTLQEKLPGLVDKLVDEEMEE